MDKQTVQGHGRFEQLGGYARAKRVGPHVFVAGTTAIEASGRLHAPGDTYEQTLFVLGLMDEYLAAVGAGLEHVVRTLAFLHDMSTAAAFAKAHGEVFAEILPVCTAVGASLTVPGMMVEIELQALVDD